MRVIIDYNTCPPSSYGKYFLSELGEKLETIEENWKTMIFTRQRYDENNMLQDEEEYTIPSESADVQAIEVDLDCAGDEIWLVLDREILKTRGGSGLRNYSDSINIEVVTKEVAEENDRDFLDDEYNDLIESGYEVGDDNSYYKQIGNTEFYYREL